MLVGVCGSVVVGGGWWMVVQGVNLDGSYRGEVGERRWKVAATCIGLERLHTGEEKKWESREGIDSRGRSN